jgi:hypothetical protein
MVIGTKIIAKINIFDLKLFNVLISRC